MKKVQLAPWRSPIAEFRSGGGRTVIIKPEWADLEIGAPSDANNSLSDQ